MKKTLLMFTICIQYSILQAQFNLVPNGSFEDTVACAVNGRLYNCKFWVNCGQTPDYNNSCTPQGNAFGVPYNTLGYQPAATGNAYCDLWTYSTTQLYREFIGVQMSQAMIPGHKYFVSFKCSPASPGYGYCLQSNKQGIRFSTVSYDSINSPPINNFAHIYSDSVVKDTVGWTIISGNFIADSSYTFLSIGNFFDDLHTDTVIPGFQCQAFAVYYIDDVEVIDSATGIYENNHSNLIKYYQQGDQLVFSSEFPIINEVELFDCTGRKILNVHRRNDTNFFIDVRDITDGIYITRVFFQNKIISLKCLIIKKK
jgi:hypothetical protein